MLEAFTENWLFDLASEEHNLCTVAGGSADGYEVFAYFMPEEDLVQHWKSVTDSK